MWKENLELVLVVALGAALAVPSTAQVDTGTADFSTYVSIGDSIGAGFMSGSLHIDGQVKSFPALIDLQVNGPAAGFEQPLVSAPGIPNVLHLQSLAPVVLAPRPGRGAPLNLALPRPYNNMAVPGARVGDVVRTRSGGLHDLVLRNLGTQLELSAALAPTFVTIWIGNNDVLGAATSGIVIDGITLTRTDAFETDLRAIVGTLGAVGVGGWAIATIPAVTALPFVSTLPPFLVDPLSGEPVLVAGSLVPLIGPDGPLTPADKVLLPASELLARGVGIPAALGGTGQPLPDDAVLDAGEVATIEARREELNGVIRAVAADGNGALVDTAGVFDRVRQNGLLLGGVVLTTDFLTGGLFTYDGVHPSPVAHAVVANLFIAAINSHYGAAIPQIGLEAFVLGDLGRYPGAEPVGTLAGTSGQVIYTSRAYRNLRRALNVPSAKRLEKLKRRLTQKATADERVLPTATAGRRAKTTSRRAVSVRQ